MNFLIGIFGFFKMPFQIALGLYFAFLLLIGTVAGISYYTEGFDHCADLELLVDYRPIAILLKHIS